VDVKDHQMWAELVEQLHSLLAVEGEHGLETGIGEKFRQCVAQGMIVVDNQNKIFFVGVHRRQFCFRRNTKKGRIVLIK
jgi:hypothetical protein